MTTTTKAKTPVKKTTSKATTARVTATPSLPNNPFVFEVLDIVSRQKTNSKKSTAQLLKHCSQHQD